MLYSGIDFIAFYFIYAFLGWCFEVAVLAVAEHRFGNRGILNAPICGIYGITMNILILTTGVRQESMIWQCVLCVITAAAVEILSGRLCQRLMGKSLWDYEGNSVFTGHRKGFLISLFVGGGFLAVLKLVHPLVLLLVHMVPDLLLKILCIGGSVLLVLDFLSVCYIGTQKRKLKEIGNLGEELMVQKLKFSQRIYRHIWQRLDKAYPDKGKSSVENVFANGLCMDKIIWVFLISSVLGDLIEMLYVHGVSGIWMRRSSLVLGPFSVVWGLGAALLTVVLGHLMGKEDRYIFVGGFFLGGAYEYLCSVFTEVVFGTKFWDYSSMPFNIGGRTNLLFCLFWGVLSLVWIKFCYPRLSALIERIPPIAGTVTTWLIVVLMACDMLVTVCVLARYTDRKQDPVPSNIVESYVDLYYPEPEVERLWPNMKLSLR